MSTLDDQARAQSWNRAIAAGMTVPTALMLWGFLLAVMRFPGEWIVATVVAGAALYAAIAAQLAASRSSTRILYGVSAVVVVVATAGVAIEALAGVYLVLTIAELGAVAWPIAVLYLVLSIAAGVQVGRITGRRLTGVRPSP